jgi:hypothetical protein
MVKADPSFERVFEGIRQRWAFSAVTPRDLAYLASTPIEVDEYESVGDLFGLRHGVELMDSRIILHDSPTRLHEQMSRAFDRWVQSSYGLTLGNIGSSSKYP